MSSETERRHRLKLVALLADVTPPREASRGGTQSEHAVAPGILVHRLVGSGGERAYRVIVRGALVMDMVDRGDAPPGGFSLPGEWADILVAAAVSRIVPDEAAEPSLGPPRRQHAHPSPYAARPTLARPPAVGPRFVRSLAQFTASLGSPRSRDPDSITLDIDALEFRAMLVRLEAEVVVLAYLGGRLRLSALLSREAPSRPARTILRHGSDWHTEPRKELERYVSWVHPKDLVRFCRHEA